MKTLHKNATQGDTTTNHIPNTNPLHSEKISLVKKLAILGSTGSIGHSTLSICESFPDRYQVISLAAGQNLEVAFAQCLRWRPRVISLATEELAAALAARLKAEGITDTELVHGTARSVLLATLPELDFVVSAIVGVSR